MRKGGGEPLNRTLKQFVDDARRANGARLSLRHSLFRGVYLEDEETGNTYEVGLVRWREVLSPAVQASICRALFRPQLAELLGLDPIDDDGSDV